LTATDSTGLSDTATLDLFPNTVDFTFETNVPGLRLSLNSFTGVTPFTRTVIAGSNNSISAPSPQTLQQSSYAFASWSDGGAQSHSVVATSQPATYAATFTSTTSGPEMDLRGNNVSIVDGDTSPSATDNTDFGSQDAASGSGTRTFTIANSGTAALGLSGTPRVQIGGTNGTDFTVSVQP